MHIKAVPDAAEHQHHEREFVLTKPGAPQVAGSRARSDPRHGSRPRPGVRLGPDVPLAMEAAISFPYDTDRPLVSDNTLALAVYVLYGVGYFTGITALIGVIIAHVKIDDADPVLHSHYQFQIRTFWIGLLYITIGTLLSVVLIGIPILVWWFVWSLVRIIKGGLLLTEHRPIVNPVSWLFG